MTIRQIARDLGVHPSTVSRAIRSGRDPAACRPRAPSATEDAQEIVMARLGHDSGPEIADAAGISRAAVHRIAKRAGVSVGRPDPGPIPTQSIDEMRPMDAIEHLRFLVEQLTGTRDDLAEVRARLRLSRPQAQIYCTLAKNPGHTVGYDTLVWVITRDPDRPTDVAALYVHVTGLRKRLPPGERIETVHGYGYRLIRD